MDSEELYYLSSYANLSVKKSASHTRLWVKTSQGYARRKKIIVYITFLLLNDF